MCQERRGSSSGYLETLTKCPHPGSVAAMLLAAAPYRACGCTVIQIPLRGRKVTLGSTSTGRPGTRSRRYLAATIPSTICISIMAKALPMHIRGPAANGT